MKRAMLWTCPLLGALVLLVVWFQMDRGPRIKEGMTDEEIARILGKPRFDSFDPSTKANTKVWKTKSGFIYAHFDATGRVVWTDFDSTEKSLWERVREWIGL